jgi:CheY-like chemotaxis protein
MPAGRRVLLVDDDDSARRSLRLFLEAHGHTVEEANDGLEGVKKALAWRADVAVVDIEMPLIDGYGMAGQVRQALGGDIYLIALAGHAQPELALAAGFDQHLLKPCDPEDILKCLT